MVLLGRLRKSQSERADITNGGHCAVEGSRKVWFWLSGPFILLLVGTGVNLVSWPGSVFGLAVAAMPGLYASEVPERLSPVLRFASAIAIAAVLWMRRSSLSVWVIDLGAIVAFALFAVGVFDVVLLVRGRSSVRADAD